MWRNRCEKTRFEEPEDIDYCYGTICTPITSGLTKWEGECLVPAFPNAKHIVSQIEWDEMREPNIRSRNTYWKMNWEPIVDLVQPFREEVQIIG